MRPTLLALLGLLLVACPHASLAQDVQEAPAETVEVEDPRPGPPPPLPDLSDPNGKAAEALNEPGERSAIPKVLRSSGSRAGGPANELNPSGRAEAPAPPKGDLAQVAAGKELFHGNYCGKGQRGEGLPPTDALDAACMRHDACYDNAGHHSCACDATLKREASVVADATNASLEVRRRALSVVEATAAMDCRAP
ncbi:phospholipase A2 family protein [Methylobacterium mesophilicum]